MSEAENDTLQMLGTMTEDRSEFERLKVTKIEVCGVVRTFDTLKIQCQLEAVKKEYGEDIDNQYEQARPVFAAAMALSPDDAAKLTFADMGLIWAAVNKRAAVIKKNIDALAGLPLPTE